MQPEIEGLQLWFSVVGHSFISYYQEQRTFLENFREWKRTRKHTISVLNDLADHLDNTKRNTTKVRIAGSSASIIGGITSVVPFVASIVPAIAAPLLAAGPLALIVGGTVTTLGSIAVEEKLKASALELVKQSLEDDRDATEVIRTFPARGQELRQAIENVMSIDLFEELIEVFRRLRRDFFPDDTEDPCSSMQYSLTTSRLPGFQNLDDVRLRIFMRAGLGLINLLQSQSNAELIVFEGISATLKIVSSLMPTAVATLHGATSFADACAAANVAEATSNATMTMAVGIVMDCFSTYKAIKDLYKNSPSECASKIQEAVYQLERELEYFTQLFETLSNTRMSS